MNPKLARQQVEALYEQHAVAVHRFLLGVLRDGDLAEEALQQTFVRLLEQGHTAQADTMQGWIYKVAFNQAMALRRRRLVDQRVVQQMALDPCLLAPQLAEPEPAAGDRVAADEDLLRAQAAVAELPPAQREVLYLRFTESKTFAQIAESLGVPLGTALTRMRLALVKLRRVLQ